MDRERMFQVAGNFIQDRLHGGQEQIRATMGEVWGVLDRAAAQQPEQVVVPFTEIQAIASNHGATFQNPHPSFTQLQINLDVRNSQVMVTDPTDPSFRRLLGDRHQPLAAESRTGSVVRASSVGASISRSQPFAGPGGPPLSLIGKRLDDVPSSPSTWYIGRC